MVRHRIAIGFRRRSHRHEASSPRESDLVRQVTALAAKAVAVVQYKAALVERALKRRVRIRSRALTDRLGPAVGVDKRLLQRLIELGIRREALAHPIEIGLKRLR
jgi:hypothetical protein